MRPRLLSLPSESTDLQHPAHAESLDFAKRFERDSRQLFDERAKRSCYERLRSGRDLSVYEHERQQRVVDERMNLCSREQDDDFVNRRGPREEITNMKRSPFGFSASYQSTPPPRTPFLIMSETSELFLLT